VHEPWWTATARHADIVLPATTSLERNDIGCAPRDSFVITMQQAIDPVGDARSDFAIFSELARRLGCDAAYTEGRDEMGWLRYIYERWHKQVRANQATIPEFDCFWRDGWLEIPQRAEEYVLFSEFRADLEEHKLATPSGRIELFSARIASFGYDDCPAHPTWLEPAEWLGGTSAEKYPLHLISSQPRYRLHSQMDPGPVSAQGKVAGREAVAISPADAKWRGIADGDVVRVYNSRGACLAGAVVTDAVSEGVLRLSCGAWYDPASLDDDAICLHGNANVLTRDQGTSKLSQGPSCATALVQVERFKRTVPPVRAFVPPTAENTE
jgi:biotin/methionine sulfoxide reductase